jgi:hypothetical protein
MERMHGASRLLLFAHIHGRFVLVFVLYHTVIALTFQRHSYNNHTFPSTLYSEVLMKSQEAHMFDFTTVMEELHEIHDVVLNIPFEQDIDGGCTHKRHSIKRRKIRKQV